MESTLYGRKFGLEMPQEYTSGKLLKNCGKHQATYFWFNEERTIKSTIQTQAKPKAQQRQQQ